MEEAGSMERLDLVMRIPDATYNVDTLQVCLGPR
jgi:hypothetical protein